MPATPKIGISFRLFSFPIKKLEKVKKRKDYQEDTQAEGKQSRAGHPEGPDGHA